MGEMALEVAGFASTRPTRAPLLFLKSFLEAWGIDTSMFCNKMDISEDEMLFDTDVTHDNERPLITDNDEQQVEESNNIVAKRGKKRLRATQQSSSSSDGPGRSDFQRGLPSPVSPNEVNTMTATEDSVPPRGKRDRY